METVCQVAFNLMGRAEARRAEEVVREYLLRVSDQVCMIHTGSSYLSVFNFFSHPIQTKRFRSMLKDGDIAQEDDRSCLFNLTENTKQLLNQTGLLFTGSRSIFYGFTDPKFMKAGHEVGSVMNTDKIVSLHIPDSEKAQIAAQGVYLDSPQI